MHTQRLLLGPLCVWGTGASRTRQDCPWETVGHKGLKVSLWHNFIRKSELRGSEKGTCNVCLGYMTATATFIHRTEKPDTPGEALPGCAPFLNVTSTLLQCTHANCCPSAASLWNHSPLFFLALSHLQIISDTQFLMCSLTFS